MYSMKMDIYFEIIFAYFDKGNLNVKIEEMSMNN